MPDKDDKYLMQELIMIRKEMEIKTGKIDTEEQKNSLWKMRRSVAEAVKANSIYKEADTVAPRYELPKLLKGIKEIGAKYGFQSVCYGHAGDVIYMSTSSKAT